MRMEPLIVLLITLINILTVSGGRLQLGYFKAHKNYQFMTACSHIDFLETDFNYAPIHHTITFRPCKEGLLEWFLPIYMSLNVDDQLEGATKVLKTHLLAISNMHTNIKTGIFIINCSLVSQ